MSHREHWQTCHALEPKILTTCSHCGEGLLVIGHGTSLYYDFRGVMNSPKMDALRVTETLMLNPQAIVEMRCASQEEALSISMHLTKEDNDRVRWVWREVTWTVVEKAAWESQRPVA